jgi:prolyl oligopeptidase
MFVIQDSLDGEPEVLLDPNALSEDGTVSLNTLSVSEDAKYLGYGLCACGLRIRRLKLKLYHG